MSKFEVPVVKIREIEEIQGADAIELAVVGEYRSVVRKGQFKSGDLVVYIPEASVLPVWLIKQMGLEGRLAGSDSNRVKAVRLRGCLSQGLVYPLNQVNDSSAVLLVGDGIRGAGWDVVLGENVADYLEITKWEPPIPAHMSGEVCNINGKTVGYDFENVKKYPDIFRDGELVTMTEKLHGTYCQIGVVHGLDHDELYKGVGYVASKGLGAQGLVFKFNEVNRNNVYFRGANSLENEHGTIWDRLIKLFPGQNVYLMGEVYGFGIQDLTYGLKDVSFRAFDIYVGHPHGGRYLNVDEKIEVFELLGVKMVPILYRGPYSRDIAIEHREGATVEGKGSNIREGIVITPDVERRDENLGRVIFKDISPAYLLRKDKNATEYN